MINEAAVPPPPPGRPVASELHRLMCMTGADLAEAKFCLEAACSDVDLAVRIFETQVARGSLARMPPAPGLGNLSLPWWHPRFWDALRLAACDGGGPQFRRFVDTTVQLLGGAVLATIWCWLGMR
eukprot:evm.model.scf_5238.1 EVM.evm.TU.scf_5238.1   scf_5238:2120-2494(-)